MYLTYNLNLYSWLLLRICICPCLIHMSIWEAKRVEVKYSYFIFITCPTDACTSRLQLSSQTTYTTEIDHVKRIWLQFLGWLLHLLKYGVYWEERQKFAFMKSMLLQEQSYYYDNFIFSDFILFALLLGILFEMYYWQC